MSKRIMIGADPEFMCMQGREVAGGQELAGRQDVYSNEIGCDGNGMTTEIRPEPAVNPIEVVANIHDILVRKASTHENFQKYEWHAGSSYNGWPLGGHIHFGVPLAAGELGGATVYDAHAKLVAACDSFLAPVVTIIDKDRHASKRRNQGYGYLGDYRQQTYGVEYRMPGSWLTSPYVAAGVLALAKTVVHEMVNNFDKFPTDSPIQMDSYNRMYNRQSVRDGFDNLWNTIEKFELYEEYKEYIEVLRFLAKNKLTWFPKGTMKEAWGIVDLSPVFVKTVPLRTIWNEVV